MPYSTGDSLVVPYQSTDPAQRCLTSQFGWDAVLSPWYDRMTRVRTQAHPGTRKKQFLQKKTGAEQNRFVCFFFSLVKVP